MYLDDVSQSVMRELARIHKRKIAPLKKLLNQPLCGLPRRIAGTIHGIEKAYVRIMAFFTNLSLPS